MQMMMMFDVEGVTVGRETSTATTSSSPRILLVFLLRMARAAPRAAARERERASLLCESGALSTVSAVP